jgi:hypothetical protein
MKKERFLLLCMAFVTMIITSFSMMQPVYAIWPWENTYDCRICGETHDVSELAYTQKVAIEWHDVLYSGDWFGEAESGATLSTVDVLKFDGGRFSTVWSTAETLYGIIRPAGVLLCFIYAMMELIEKSTTDSVSPEMVVRSLAKLLLGILIVQNGFQFCSITVGISSTAFEQLTAATGFNKTGLSCLYVDAATFLTEDFCAGALSMSETMLPFIIVFITKIIIAIMCWARVLDIMIRVVLAPIGMSDIMIAGTRGSGWAFFKRLLVSAFQGTIIMGIMYGYSIVLQAIEANAVTTNLPSYGLAVILAGVTLFSILKSQGYAQEVIG